MRNHFFITLLSKMSGVVHIDTPIKWNQPIDEAMLKDIINVIVSGRPVTMRIYGVPNGIEMVEEMRHATNDNTHRKSWDDWIGREEVTEATGFAQLTQALSNDEKTTTSWQGLVHTLHGLDVNRMDPTGITMVGNCVPRAKVIQSERRVKPKAFSTHAHWHAPPVINMHLFGTAKKVYKFVKWDDMSVAQQNAENPGKLQDDDAAITASIGLFEAGNCIIFPPRMLHDVVTIASQPVMSLTLTDKSSLNSFFTCEDMDLFIQGEIDEVVSQILRNSKSYNTLGASEEEQEEQLLFFLRNDLSSLTPFAHVAKEIVIKCLEARRFEKEKKALYLGFGTYFLFKTPAFVQFAIEILDESINFGSWRKQLAKSDDGARKVNEQFRRSWTGVSTQQPASVTAPVRGPTITSRDGKRTKQTARVSNMLSILEHRSTHMYTPNSRIAPSRVPSSVVADVVAAAAASAGGAVVAPSGPSSSAGTTVLGVSAKAAAGEPPPGPTMRPPTVTSSGQLAANLVQFTAGAPPPPNLLLEDTSLTEVPLGAPPGIGCAWKHKKTQIPLRATFEIRAHEEQNSEMFFVFSDDKKCDHTQKSKTITFLVSTFPSQYRIRSWYRDKPKTKEGYLNHLSKVSAAKANQSNQTVPFNTWANVEVEIHPLRLKYSANGVVLSDVACRPNEVTPLGYVGFATFDQPFQVRNFRLYAL